MGARVRRLSEAEGRRRGGGVLSSVASQASSGRSAASERVAPELLQGGGCD